MKCLWFLVATLLWGSGAWAEAAVSLKGLSYQAGCLRLSGEGRLPEPVVQAWPSVAGEEKTEMLVLDLPGVTVSPENRQALSAAILKASPEVRRLRLVPTGGGQGLRVLMEVSRSQGALAQQEPQITVSHPQASELWIQLVPPPAVKTPEELPEAAPPPEKPKTLQIKSPKAVATSPPGEADGLRQEIKALSEALKASQSASRQQVTALQGKIQGLEQGNQAQSVKAQQEPTSQVQAAQVEGLQKDLQQALAQLSDLKTQHAQAKRESEQAQAQRVAQESELAKIKAELTQAVAERQQVAQRLKDVEKKQTAARPRKVLAVAQDTRQVLSLAAELQRTVKQRDSLEEQVAQLQGQQAKLMEDLKTKEETLGELRRNLALQEDSIRLSDASLNLSSLNPSDPQVVQNLKAALLKVAAKLKEKTDAVAALTAENTALRKGEKPAPSASAPKPVAQESIPGKILYRAATKPSEGPTAFLSLSTPPAAEQRKDALMQEIARRPDAYGAYVELAGLYTQGGQTQEAEHTLQNLLLINPRYSEAYWHLAHVYLAQKKPQEAEAVLTTYRRLNPGDKRIPELLAQISQGRARLQGGTSP